MVKAWLFSFYLFIGLGTISQAYSETLRVGFRAYPPLMMKDSKAGIYYDILQEIAARSNLIFDIEFAQASRSNALFEQGGIDIEPGVNPVWRKKSKLQGDYSIPFAKSEDVILFRAKNLLDPASIDNLKGKQVGGIRGFTYPMFTDSFANGDIGRFDLKDGPSLFKFFIADRIDYIIINKVVAEYWISNHPEYRFSSLPNYIARKQHSNDAISKILIGDIISSVDLMIRVHPRKRHVLTQLNNAIAELKSEGKIKHIFARYR